MPDTVPVASDGGETPERNGLQRLLASVAVLLSRPSPKMAAAPRRTLTDTEWCVDHDTFHVGDEVTNCVHLAVVSR